MATVIAEKLEAMVVRGGSNSRMKDFYDIWQLSRLAEHSARTLRTAIENTFQRRGTEFPRELPYALLSLPIALKSRSNGMLSAERTICRTLLWILERLL